MQVALIDYGSGNLASAAKALARAAGETGHEIITTADPDIVRGADISFVAKLRIPNPRPVTFFEGPPDLAVEVVSPGDLIVGDEDGLIAIPAVEAADVLVRAQALATKEDGDKAAIRGGSWDRSWVTR